MQVENGRLSFDEMVHHFMTQRYWQATYDIVAGFAGIDACGEGSAGQLVGAGETPLAEAGTLKPVQRDEHF